MDRMGTTVRSSVSSIQLCFTCRGIGMMNTIINNTCNISNLGCHDSEIILRTTSSSKYKSKMVASTTPPNHISVCDAHQVLPVDIIYQRFCIIKAQNQIFGKHFDFQRSSVVTGRFQFACVDPMPTETRDLPNDSEELLLQIRYFKM